MSYTNSPAGIRTAAEVKSDEKEDMKKLTDKLALYVDKVRQLGDGGRDSAAFLASLRNVEDEVNKLKALYEAELDSLRQQLDAANREKNNSLTETEKYKRSAADFDDRFRSEADKNARLINDVNLLQQRIAALEQELANTRAAIQVPQTHLVGAQSDLKQALAKNDELARQLEQERSKSKQLHDKVNTLQQQLDFNDQVHIEQLRDANSRLGQSKDVILKLEDRTKNLESQNASMPEMLEEMRRKTEQEINNYKANMDGDHNRNIAALRTQLAGQDRTIEQLKLENAQLQAANDNVEAKMRTLDSQVRDLKAKKAVLEDLVNKEKSRGADQIRSLERKLKELQDLLFSKMQEMNASREVQGSMRAEIENMRVILQEEERRLGCSLVRQPSVVSYTKPSNEYASIGNQGNQYMHVNDDINRSKSEDRKCAGSSAGQVVRYSSDPRTEYQFSYNAEDKHRGYAGSGGMTKSSVNVNEQTSCFPKRETNPASNSWSGYPHDNSVAYKQTRSRTSNDGFPKLTTDNTCKGGWTTGSSKLYMNRRNNDTTYTSAYCRNMRYGLPKVY